VGVWRASLQISKKGYVAAGHEHLGEAHIFIGLVKLSNHHGKSGLDRGSDTVANSAWNTASAAARKVNLKEPLRISVAAAA